MKALTTYQLNCMTPCERRQVQAQVATAFRRVLPHIVAQLPGEKVTELFCSIQVTEDARLNYLKALADQDLLMQNTLIVVVRRECDSEPGGIHERY